MQESMMENIVADLQLLHTPHSFKSHSLVRKRRFFVVLLYGLYTHSTSAVSFVSSVPW